MAKAQSPLLGYNTNVRHKGKVFHIQTEDSGVTRPHVITHLFADGGRVLKTAKTSYAELVGADDLPAQVKKLMQDQHKGMFVALRDGQFDGQFEPAPSHATPVAPLTSAAAVVSSTPVIAVEPAVVAPAEVEPAPEAAFDDDRPTLQVPPPAARPAPIEPAMVDLSNLASAPDDESAIEVDESQFIEPTESFSIPPDLGAIDLSATIQTPPQVAPSARRSGPWTAAPRAPAAPSPLASATGSTRPPPLRPAAARAPMAPVRTRAPAITPGPSASRAPLSTATKTAPLATKSSTGFGDRLVSERSLDEVILAYLAEELEDR